MPRTINARSHRDDGAALTDRLRQRHCDQNVTYSSHNLSIPVTISHIRHYSAEDKLRIVLEGLRGEDSIAELCRQEGINANVDSLKPQNLQILEDGRRVWKEKFVT